MVSQTESVSDEDCQNLLLLLKATQKSTVVNFLQDVFEFRNSELHQSKISEYSNELGIQTDELLSLFSSCCSLIRVALYSSHSENPTTYLFPSDFHAQLRALLTRLVKSALPQWRQTAALQVVGPPRLADFDWRMDIKTSSRNVPRMSVPTVFVSMKLNDPITPTDKNTEVQFELSKESLKTMLDSLHKIRDQLNSMK
eukprot:181868_1